MQGHDAHAERTRNFALQFPLPDHQPAQAWLRPRAASASRRDLKLEPVGRAAGGSVRPVASRRSLPQEAAVWAASFLQIRLLIRESSRLKLTVLDRG